MPEFYRVAATLIAGMRGLYQFPASVRPPFRIVLNFTIQRQVMDEWCWAAVASSVSHFYLGDRAIDQKWIVARHLGRDRNTPTDETWDHSAPMLVGLQFVGCTPIYKSGPISFWSVLRKLDGGDPICVQIRWKDAKGNDTAVRHAVVITSCWRDEEDRPFYMVGDPGEGDSEECSESEVQSSYMAANGSPGGRWEATFFVSSP